MSAEAIISSTHATPREVTPERASDFARILGCAVGTSKSQLHKARTKLRKLLNPR